MDELGLRVARKVAVATSRRGFLGWVGRGAAAALGVATAGVLLGNREAQAAPNRCAVLCADQPGARGAACRQVCKQCDREGGHVCVTPSGVICCPQGTICTGTGCEEI
jgi:hypothetical protein